MNKNKEFDIIKFLLMVITFMMVVLAINIFFISEDIFVAKANDMNESINQSNNDGNVDDSFFIHILNKSMSLLELNYKENSNSSSNSLAKYLVNKTIDFDYKNPKNFLKAQLSMLNNMDAEINNEPIGSNNILGPDKDGRFYNPEEYRVEDSPNNYGEELNNASMEDLNKNGDDLTVLNPNEYEGEDSHGSVEGESNTDQEINDDIEIISTLPPTPKKITHNMDQSLIFIYHTHGTESYKPESIENYHSLKREFTVLKVGEELKKNLENRGYKVIHDETLHDYPSYAGSYSRSLETLSNNLEKASSLKVVFDVHRDGIDNVDNLEAKEYDMVRKSSYVTVNGEKVARFSLVVGEGNENAEDIKNFAYYIKAISDEIYPGLANKVILKKYKYNQYKSDYSVLFEIGNNTNNIDEALRTSKYLSIVLDTAFKRVVNN